jgi:7-carboxy-7-deazaguanine synthase (Cx14CxxC type)
MTYSVKEIYYTLQGEGVHTGRPAIFCRFAGCNLWTGREQDRAKAICQFCDTDFVGVDGPGGGQFITADDLASEVYAQWPDDASKPFIVFTGGEPLLQLDAPLITAFKARDCLLAVETNGAFIPPPGLDWICMSPKAGAELNLTRGDELKLVYPQEGLDPSDVEQLDFDHFALQPMDGPERQANTLSAIDYCRAHPRWRLCLQTHKFIGLP